MTIGLFSDRERKPTRRQIAKALGSRRPLWDRLLRFISETYQIPADLTFGGTKYGWNLWYRKGGKTLVSLYPQESHFVAQIVLGAAQAEAALALPLGENVRRAVEEAPQRHDGRWLFLRVRTLRDVKDVEQLLRIKRSPRRSATPGAT